MAPTAEDPAECVTDKGYHSRLVLNGWDSALIFDTHEDIQELVNSGMPEPQAAGAPG